MASELTSNAWEKFEATPISVSVVVTSGPVEDVDRPVTPDRAEVLVSKSCMAFLISEKAEILMLRSSIRSLIEASRGARRASTSAATMFAVSSPEPTSRVFR